MKILIFLSLNDDESFIITKLLCGEFLFLGYIVLKLFSFMLILISILWCQNLHGQFPCHQCQILKSESVKYNIENTYRFCICPLTEYVLRDRLSVYFIGFTSSLHWYLSDCTCFLPFLHKKYTCPLSLEENYYKINSQEFKNTCSFWFIIFYCY